MGQPERQTVKGRLHHLEERLRIRPVGVQHGFASAELVPVHADARLLDGGRHGALSVEDRLPLSTRAALVVAQPVARNDGFLWYLQFGKIEERVHAGTISPASDRTAVNGAEREGN